MRWRRHERLGSLLRYADDEASRHEQARIRDHLEECRRCRLQLEFILELKGAASELVHPAPPSSVLDGALERLADGEALLLPLDAPPAPSWQPQLSGLAALVFVIGVLGLSLPLLFHGEAHGGSSTLETSPAEEGRLVLEFRTASRLAEPEELRARVWYRTSTDPLPRHMLGHFLSSELSRTGSGEFRGDIELPPSAVYAAFSVESPDRQAVESNGAQLWEWLSRDDDGIPLFEALKQRFRVLEARRSPQVLDAVRHLSELYPDEPEGWFHRFVYEVDEDPAARPALLVRYQTELVRLDGVLSARGTASANEVAAMAQLAERLDAVEIFNRWRQRLLRDHPTHAVAVQYRVIDALRSFRADPPRLLEVLEAEWQQTGTSSELLAEAGFFAAQRAGDAAAVGTWGDRFLLVRPDLAARIIRVMAAFPENRPRAAEIARQHLRRLSAINDADREPHLTPAKQRERNDSEARWLLLALGRILVDQGRPAAALDTLSRAAASGWDSELFRELAETRLATGDTVGARRLAAFLAVDPFPTADAGAFIDELASAPGTDWDVLAQNAHEEMRRRIMETALSRSLDTSVTVLAGDGTERRLAEILRNSPVLLVYCTASMRACREDFPTLHTAVESLRRAGARAFIIVPPSSNPLPPATTVESPEPPFPTLLDHTAEVARVLQNWRIPQYVVVDRDGRIRFDHGRATDAVRQALLMAERGIR